MARVALKGMKFYAFHGYYDFERRIGNNFEVDLEATLKIKEDPNDRIEATINYEEMYAICEQHMQMKYLLLESLAYDIACEIKRKHPIVEKIEVKLAKLNPPVGGKVDRAIVTIEL
ncbi:MAG: dihydroneopterin aldolase [Saprospiraceae bacterium]|jgi:dihydroneopterin aldolase